jgi:hypothetical protein
MKTGSHVIDSNLHSVARRWRSLRFLQHTGTLGALVSLLFLLLALAAVRGWIADPGLATGLATLAVFVALVAWGCVGFVLLHCELAPQWMAGVLERSQPKLLDRVNTLVALRENRQQPGIKSFYRRIARQAQELLTKAPPSLSISPWRAVLHVAVFLALLVATLLVYEKYSPWQLMHAAREAKQAAAKPQPAEPTLELPLPDDAVEQKLPWGEVRITEPGRDLQVTKVDVVPLQIEAAANEPLQQVGWSTTINGRDETPRELPAPSDPRYAVYQPTLYLDELKLADWDVLTYYAKANTRATNAYASEVYFLEVRPFREDILKLPGGENGKAMQCLNELSALIAQQQHIIRQTHQHVQKPPELTKLREQDRQKLADAEADLSKGTQHLYARMAAELENKPIGEALDHLAKAEKWLAQASDSLRGEAMADAQNQERDGLADLVAARKAFQKSVSENPNDFAEPSEQQPPIAEPKDKLKELAEFRNEEKAAQEFVQALLQQQRSFAERVNKSALVNLPKMAEEQKNIGQSLEEFRQQHPQVFKPVQEEADTTAQSLQKAADSLAQRNRNAKSEAQQGAEQIQKLAEAMKATSGERRLADAYKLRQVLEQQATKFGQCENPGASGAPSEGEMKQAVADTRQALKQLKSVAEQPPANQLFGPQLRESLNDLNMQSLNWPLGELEQAQSDAARQKAAGQVKQGLEKVVKAFDASQPQVLQLAKQSGQQGEQSRDSLERGLAQLQSLIKQLEEHRPLSREAQLRQGQEALYNLQQGMRGDQGQNERSQPILVALDQELKPSEDKPIDLIALKRLADQLQAFSIELYAKRDPKQDKPEVSVLDSTRLPPAYRKRIETYFQKLSEK